MKDLAQKSTYLTDEENQMLLDLLEIISLLIIHEDDKTNLRAKHDERNMNIALN